jgi:hypothetical protein
MAVTYVPIATQTLASAASAVTFNSIPSTYTDLVLVAVVKNTSTLNNGQIYFNNDTSSVYSGTYIQGNGSVAASSRVTGVSNCYTPEISTTDWTVITANIMNYTNTTTFKTTLIRGGTASDRTAAWVDLYRSTNAINRIDFATYGGNLAAGSTFSLYGVAAASIGAKATGGNIVTTDGVYWYHAFLASGTFAPTQTISCDVMTIAGGGGGFNGGGGAGGFRVLTSQSLSTNNYTVTIGGGGAGGGSSGTNTTVSGTGLTTISTTGGGRGGFQSNGLSGGSGGGSADNGNVSRTGGAGNAGSYSPSEGNNGGNSASMSLYVGGGGGGAGVAGGNSTSSVPAAGGNGTSAYSSWGSATGTGQNISGTYWFAGGGSGADQNGNSAAGGNGGGGQGDRSPNTGIRNNGLANMGAGGGGGYFSVYGNGGSGLVIVRYAV